MILENIQRQLIAVMHKNSLAHLEKLYHLWIKVNNKIAESVKEQELLKVNV